MELAQVVKIPPTDFYREIDRFGQRVTSGLMNQGGGRSPWFLF